MSADCGDRADPLARYRAKRDFTRTSEPPADRVDRRRGGSRAAAPRGAPAFVIQKHAARRLHYDLRLEIDGVFVSWAVP